jgi:hypothetical protein
LILKEYPKKLGKTLLQERIIGFKRTVRRSGLAFCRCQTTLKKLPEILGKNQEKTYLLLFQNDKELRATGGFLTAYAVFKIKTVR